MNCDKCLEKCKAECCTIVPFNKDILQKHLNVRPIKEILEIDDKILILTETSACCFLGYNNKCSIYKDRPEICKMFGNGGDLNLTCCWQDENGVMRSRQDRRLIARKQQEYQDKITNYEKTNQRIN